MTGMTDYSADNWLAYIVGKTAMPTMPTAYLALFTAVGIDAGTGFTEVSGGSYARVNVSADFAAAANSAPSTIQNNTTITMATPTGNWGTVIAWGLFDAATSGNLLFWDYLGNNAWTPFTATLASPSVFTLADTTNYSPTNGDSVVVSAEYGGTLPTGSFTGLLTVAGVSGTTFNVGVNATVAGAGLVRKVSSQVINTGVVASFASGALVLSAA